MKNTVFTGAATAIITPMTETGVDYEALCRLIDFQLEQGIDAIVASGTTGEGSILYNVPSRTGLNMLPETLNVLADHERIAALKEACGNISQVAKEMEMCGDRLDVYSGNDDQTVPILSLGGKGVISTVSNIIPAEMAAICRKFFAGDVKGAAELQLRYLRLMNQMMIETNPIPVKGACAAMGFGKYILRLPLVEMEENNYRKMLQLMQEQGLEVQA